MVRDPHDVRSSLIRRWKHSKRPEVYLKRGLADLPRLFGKMYLAAGDRHLWDDLVRYEDFSQLGELEPLESIIARNARLSEWCRNNHRPQKWGLGGIRPNGASQAEVDALRLSVRQV